MEITTTLNNGQQRNKDGYEIHLQGAVESKLTLGCGGHALPQYFLLSTLGLTVLKKKSAILNQIDEEKVQVVGRSNCKEF